MGDIREFDLSDYSLCLSLFSILFLRSVFSTSSLLILSST